jgi:DNA-binding HxlR family transcriptional regulator
MEWEQKTIRHSVVQPAESGYHLVRRSMVKRRKSKVTPPPSECPLSQCMRLLGGTWTAHVIWYLREGERCFSELQTDIEGISAKMLTNRLRKLEREGIVERTNRATSPPTVWYALTPVGKELCAALVNVIDVAQRVRRARAASG